MTPSAWRLQRYDTLPSTSDHCIARAEAGEPGGLAVLARSQTRARGSRGRSWSEAAGTLALSVLLRPTAGLEPPAIWPFLAALAFHDTLCAVAGDAGRIRLKWPNDVMLDGRKLGGILVERGVAAGADAGWLVIGFGANLLAAPELAGRNAACLAELGVEVSPEAVARRLLDALSLRMREARIAEAGSDAFAHIRDAWLARAHSPGTMLAVQTPDGQTAGAFCGIAEDGALLLGADSRILRISTGQILLLEGGESRSAI